MAHVLTSHGHRIESGPDRHGELLDSSRECRDQDRLRDRLDRDGYLYIRGLIPRDAVLAARLALLAGLRDAGCVDPAHPLMDARLRNGPPPAAASAPGASMRDLKELPPFRALCHHHHILELMRGLLDGEPRVLATYHLRLVAPGDATGVHCDRAYFGGTPRSLTAWIPIGDIPRELGSLMVLEGSHRDQAVRSDYSDRFGRDMLSLDPNHIRQRCGGRWLTADFTAGDMLVFGMYTLHCSLDNVTQGQLRMSTDMRYQCWSEAIDERFAGDGTPSQVSPFDRASSPPLPFAANAVAKGAAPR